MKLKDGTEYSVLTEHALGTPGNPMSDAQVEDKYRALASEILPAGNVDAVVQRIWGIDKLDSIRELMGLLSRS
jgi:2-methylcitrate dehydratase PrpD